MLGLPDLDVRILLAATHEDTADRRRERARDAHEPFVDQVLATEHDIISRQAAVADLIVGSPHEHPIAVRRDRQGAGRA